MRPRLLFVGNGLCGDPLVYNNRNHHLSWVYIHGLRLLDNFLPYTRPFVNNPNPEYRPTNPNYYIAMRFSSTAGLALALLLGTAIAAPVAVDGDGAHLDYIYTQKKGTIKRADTPAAGDVHLDYIYTQKKGEKRDEPLHLDYIYTQKKDQKRGDSPRLVDVLAVDGGPEN